MKVYHLGEKARRQKVFIMSVAPAADMRNQEVPSDWVDGDNKPVQFNLEFNYGEAEVEDSIAKYLVDKNLCVRTRLHLPPLPVLEDSVAQVIAAQG